MNETFSNKRERIYDDEVSSIDDLSDAEVRATYDAAKETPHLFDVSTGIATTAQVITRRGVHVDDYPRFNAGFRERLEKLGIPFTSRGL